MLRTIPPRLRAALANATLAFTALACLVPAATRAQTVNFNDAPPSLYLPGESFETQSLQFRVEASSPGFAVVDSAFSLSVFGNAPTGNATPYLAGFNDAVITLSSSAGAFFLEGFDYAFIPPVLSPTTASPGALVVQWMDVDGRSGVSLYDFGASQSTGAWAFRTASFASGATAALNPALQSARIQACLYTVGAGCVWPADNLAQFALDNIAVTPIPEPSTLALMALGLGLMAAGMRRRRGADRD